MNQQVEHYRRKLMKKSDKELSMAIAQEYESPLQEKYLRKESKRSPSPAEMP